MFKDLKTSKLILLKELLIWIKQLLTLW